MTITSWDRESLDDLPLTWFQSRITVEQIRACFAFAQKEIRIACGFFTVRGWGLIRRHTKNKRVYLLVGIEEPGREQARQALVADILRNLTSGRDRERRTSVEELVTRMASREVYVVDARATDHHGKLYLVDCNAAITTSANTTGRGFLNQIESGTILAPVVVERFLREHARTFAPEVAQAIALQMEQFIRNQVGAYVRQFDEYFAQAEDITAQLLQELHDWLELARPWDIYLKTILAFEQLQPVNCYGKQPVSYQQDMIAQALRQIREHGGSMLVASTGLGKTIKATHIGLQLHAQDEIDSVIIVCPKAVVSSWKNEMRDAGLHADFFTLSTLDRQSPTDARGLEDWEQIVERVRSGRGHYLLIFDESHQLRNRYPEEYLNRRYHQEARRERLAFTRINELVNVHGEKERVKVLELSGSPYAKDLDNINTQLALLPHTNPNTSDGVWRIESSQSFLDSPVTHQLTTPHVAKYYSQSDERGRYLMFGDQKRYLPNLMLYSITFPLLFDEPLNNVLAESYFDLDVNHPLHRKNIATQVKTAWASSPLALQTILEQTVDTPGGIRAFDFSRRGTSAFVVDRATRSSVLEPLIERLRQLVSSEDIKLQNLLGILQFHCPKEKVVIYCERLATAYYLEQALRRLRPNLRVFSVIKRRCGQPDTYEQKIARQIEQGIQAFAPVANNAVGKHGKTYDVLIVTDAYGVGVNLQDASVVVNYDIAWTSIEPIQRAGRILRLWLEPRTVRIYTLVPTFRTHSLELNRELVEETQRWEKLMIRHEESQIYTQFPVLTSENCQEINMPDFAPQSDVTVGTLSLEEADDSSVSPYYRHTQKLHAHREYAQQLRTDLVSALVYSGNKLLLYLLLVYENQFYMVLYDPQVGRVSEPKVEAILELIACEQETETPQIDPTHIEALSDDAIRAWCNRHDNVDENNIVRECTLLLVPEGYDRFFARVA